MSRFVGGNLGWMLSLVCLFGVSGRALLDISYCRRLITDLHPGGYDFRHLRGVSGRRDAVTKFRNLGSNSVCTFVSLII
jgi:hypothetical protein